MEVEKALKLALKNLISELTTSGELTKYAHTLHYRKQYDQFEQQYIENQRLRKELGSEYESSDSQEEKENQFSNLPQNQLKKIMRKKLFELNFDQQILEYGDSKAQEQKDIQELQNTIKQMGEEGSAKQLRTLRELKTGKSLKSGKDLNIISEAKEIIEEEEIKEGYNYGLDFLIKELERIQNQSQ